MSEELKRYKEKREAREKETAAILGKDPTGHPYDNDDLPPLRIHYATAPKVRAAQVGLGTVGQPFVEGQRTRLPFPCSRPT